MAKRRKKGRSEENEVLRIEMQPARELQLEWAGLFVPYIYCSRCKHVYSPDELNGYNWDEPLPVPTVDDDGKPEGAQDLKLTCKHCRQTRLVRVLVDFGSVEPYRVGNRRADGPGPEVFLCICPLCGGACQVTRSPGLRTRESWFCATCQLNLQRVWM